MQRFATIKTLVEVLKINANQAKAIRSLIKGDTCPLDYQSTKKYHKMFPSADADMLILCAINEILETFGIEHIKDGNINFDYCNNGDTYKPTIVYNHYSQLFRLRSWGSFFDPRKNPR